jgi:hypothetical protein
MHAGTSIFDRRDQLALRLPAQGMGRLPNRMQDDSDLARMAAAEKHAVLPSAQAAETIE